MVGEINTEELPDSAQRFITKYPKIWYQFTKLVEEGVNAGPLDEKSIRLIKAGIYGCLGKEMALKTQVRMAIKCGASADEVDHMILQILPAMGMSTTVEAWTWAAEALSDQSRSD